MDTPSLYPYQPMMRYYFQGADHAKAIQEFSAWLKHTAPAVHDAVNRARADLLSGPKAVAKGLAGLGQGDAPGDSGGIITEWGNQLLELAKGYAAYDTQRDLIKLNISRAEKGLPPISGSFIAPQVNVGASPELQMLGTIAVGGAILFAVASLLKRAR